MTLASTDNLILFKAKSKAAGGAGTPAPGQNGPSTVQPAQTQPAAGSAAGGASQPDYSAQWAEYYRSIGKHKEAEAIEAQMKNKVSLIGIVWFVMQMLI